MYIEVTKRGRGGTGGSNFVNQKGRRGALHCQPSARLKGDRLPLALTVCLPHVVELRLHCPRVDPRSHRVRVLDDVGFVAGAGARPLPTCKCCGTGSDQRAASCKQRCISAVHSVLTALGAPMQEQQWAARHPKRLLKTHPKSFYVCGEGVGDGAPDMSNISYVVEECRSVGLSLLRWR